MGTSGCLVAVIGGLVSALFANAGVIHLIRSCHDTDAGGSFTLNWSWAIAVPVLWLIDTCALSIVCFVTARIAPSTGIRIVLTVLGAIIVIAPLIWWYWSFGVSTVPTGLYSPTCPSGAPAWWPSWLPLYAP